MWFFFWFYPICRAKEILILHTIARQEVHFTLEEGAGYVHSHGLQLEAVNPREHWKGLEKLS